MGGAGLVLEWGGGGGVDGIANLRNCAVFITFIISVFGLIFRFLKLNFLTNDLTRTTGRHLVFPLGLTFIILD